MIHLHVHTERGSLLDSILSVEDIIKFTTTNNSEAIAITDHGTMSSFVDFYKSATKNNVKPILGCEVYEVNDRTFKEDTKDYKQQRYHLILLAKNQIGLQNLYKIVSEGYLSGFYVKPRIDLDYIEQNNLGEGIICLTACMAGRLSRTIQKGIVDKYSIDEYLDKLNSIFDHVALEIQSHKSEEQINLNKKIVQIAQDKNMSYVVTCDAHMLREDQLESHAIFVRIGTARETGEHYVGCYLQTENEIHDCLDEHLGVDIVNNAIKQTHIISDMIEVVDIGLNNGNLMPNIEKPDEFDSNLDYFKHIIEENWDEKFGHMTESEQQKRRDRIDMEIPVLEKLGYIDYFLMLVMLTKEAQKRNIPLGYSRGSGANCLCLFALGVTQIDSVRWNLDFSRFANLGRMSVADFDMDISKARRKEMVDVSNYLFGENKVAPICTFNGFSTKVAIKDIGKVLDETGIYKIPYTIRNEVSKLIPTIKTINDLGDGEEKEALLRDVLFTNERLKEINNQFPLWFKYVMELEGKPKSLGRHACGTLISSNPTVEYTPLCLDRDGNRITQIEMHNAMDDLGLCKMDFLGLETLDIVDDCLKMANLTWKDVDINHLDLYDKDVYDNVYKHGNTIGVFQMESAEAMKLCIEAETDNIEDIIAINAFNRPGTKSGFPTYVKNKKNPSKAKILHEDLRDIFETTNLVLLYQEQALQIFRLAGFEESEVDNARRAIGKKERETMFKLKGKFEDGLKSRRWSDKQIDEIWELMLKQAEYSFNRGHSVAYGLLSYLTAYLKHHYPLEFMTACLNAKLSDTSRTGILLNECKRLGIKVSPPNVNKSSSYYTPNPTKKEILFGLYPIKGVGEVASEYIIANRPYSSLSDFFDKMTQKGSPVNKTAINAIIKSGALPVKSKNNALIKFAEYLNPISEYKSVKTAPPRMKLLADWDIDVNEYNNDKVKILEVYNNKKQELHNGQQLEKQKLKIEEFKNKYIEDEDMYELETLSMFLTSNPFEGLSQHITDFGEIDDFSDCTMICSIIDIKRKKDKNNNQFAYLDLFTVNGIIEGVCWASSYGRYSNIIKKGESVVILGTKEEDKLVAKKFKTLKQWKQDIKVN